jgi:hypothetical protein
MSSPEIKCGHPPVSLLALCLTCPKSARVELCVVVNEERASQGRPSKSVCVACEMCVLCVSVCIKEREWQDVKGMHFWASDRVSGEEKNVARRPGEE